MRSTGISRPGRLGGITLAISRTVPSKPGNASLGMKEATTVAEARKRRGKSRMSKRKAGVSSGLLSLSDRP